MRRHEIREQGRVVVGIKVRPVHRDEHARVRPDHEPNPRPQHLFERDAVVAEQTGHLRHAALRRRVRQFRVCSTDRVNGQHGRIEHARGTVREGHHAEGMKVDAERSVHEVPSPRPYSGAARSARSGPGPSSAPRNATRSARAWLGARGRAPCFDGPRWRAGRAARVRRAPWRRMMRPRGPARRALVRGRSPAPTGIQA